MRQNPTSIDPTPRGVVACFSPPHATSAARRTQWKKLQSPFFVGKNWVVRLYENTRALSQKMSRVYRPPALARPNQVQEVIREFSAADNDQLEKRRRLDLAQLKRTRTLIVDASDHLDRLEDFKEAVEDTMKTAREVKSTLFTLNVHYKRQKETIEELRGENAVMQCAKVNAEVTANELKRELKDQIDLFERYDKGILQTQDGLRKVADAGLDRFLKHIPDEDKEAFQKMMAFFGNVNLAHAADRDQSTILRESVEDEPPKTQAACTVCMENAVRILFAPCGHQVTCKKCASGGDTGIPLTKCPYCRIKVVTMHDPRTPCE
jgi:hypothetical protein